MSTEAAKAKLEFADGTTATADVVLGADGIKSVVREAVTGVDAFKALKFGNTVCYRGLVPAQAARAVGLKRDFSDRPVCYMGQDKVCQYRWYGPHANCNASSAYNCLPYSWWRDRMCPFHL